MWDRVRGLWMEQALDTGASLLALSLLVSLSALWCLVSGAGPRVKLDVWWGGWTPCVLRVEVEEEGDGALSLSPALTSV